MPLTVVSAHKGLACLLECHICSELLLSVPTQLTNYTRQLKLWQLIHVKTTLCDSTVPSIPQKISPDVFKYFRDYIHNAYWTEIWRFQTKTFLTHIGWCYWSYNIIWPINPQGNVVSCSKWWRDVFVYWEDECSTSGTNPSGTPPPWWLGLYHLKLNAIHVLGNSVCTTMMLNRVFLVPRAV